MMTMPIATLMPAVMVISLGDEDNVGAVGSGSSASLRCPRDKSLAPHRRHNPAAINLDN